MDNPEPTFLRQTTHFELHSINVPFNTYGVESKDSIAQDSAIPDIYTTPNTLSLPTHPIEKLSLTIMKEAVHPTNALKYRKY